MSIANQLRNRPGEEIKKIMRITSSCYVLIKV